MGLGNLAVELQCVGTWSMLKHLYRKEPARLEEIARALWTQLISRPDKSMESES